MDKTKAKDITKKIKLFTEGKSLLDLHTNRNEAIEFAKKAMIKHKKVFDALTEAVTFTSYKTTRPIKPEQLSEFKRKMGNMKYAGTYSVIQTNAKTVIRIANDVLKDSRVKQMINSFGVSIDTSVGSTTRG